MDNAVPANVNVMLTLVISFYISTKKNKQANFPCWVGSEINVS